MVLAGAQAFRDDVLAHDGGVRFCAHVGLAERACRRVVGREAEDVGAALFVTVRLLD